MDTTSVPGREPHPEQNPPYSEPRVPSPQRRAQPASEQPQQRQQRRRRYGPRTCRICLDQVQPTFPDGLRSMLGGDTKPTYVSEDPELGRLVSPCVCKGSQKYVHQGCLQAWRKQGLSDRAFFQCPTCKFEYRLERMSWARWITSETSQLVLTLLIVIMLVFLLGFVADPIFELWLDPYSTIADRVSGHHGSGDGFDAEFKMEEIVEPTSWTEHFAKGFFSLGIVGMVKAFWALNPWQWWNLRHSGLLSSGRGRRPGLTGRARMEDISWTVIIVGTLTAIYTLWKGVRFVSRRALAVAGDSVLDVGKDDDDDDDGGVEQETGETDEHPHHD